MNQNYPVPHALYNKLQHGKRAKQVEKAGADAGNEDATSEQSGGKEAR